jgi:hypothetical protein
MNPGLTTRRTRRMSLLCSCALAAAAACGGDTPGTPTAGGGGVVSAVAGHESIVPQAGKSAGSGRGAGSASVAGSAASGTVAAGGASGSLVNPAPGSGFFVGANFWNVEWEGSSNYFASGVDWATTDNPWKPEFLRDLAPYRVLRFMDWNLINQANNVQASWDTRRKKSAMQTEPVAFEWQIDLCNRTQKDYWVNVPHQASAEYFTQLAQLIHDQLDPSLRVYVEWSNEVWNGQFPQRAYAQMQGQKLGLSGSDPAASYLVYQSLRLFEAFEAVFGKDSPRLVKVIAGQAASAGPCQSHVKALKDKKINPNDTAASVYAIAPYIQGDTVDALLNQGIPETKTWVEGNYKCASAAGLALIAYEGGQDSYAAGVGPCTQLQHDAAMHDVYTKFLDTMSSAKLSGPFTQYTHSGQCWGLKEKTSDTLANSPKYKGVIDWLAAHP